MKKKKIILSIIVILLLILVIFLGKQVVDKYLIKKDFENSILHIADKNENPIFKLENVILFSSCDSKNKTSSANHFTLENLYQYTDIALFIKSTSAEKTLENTLKEVSIENINFSTPILGEPNLYFKSLEYFSKSDIINENKIQDNFKFSITSEDTANLEEPVLYNNLANPITLSYVNSNIKTDYTITDTSIPITYDGSLLKRCNVSLDSIKSRVSFDVYITNNLDEKFKCSVYIDIPLEVEDKSILDGSVTEKKTLNSIFYRYE